MEVEIFSKEFIKPSSSTPDHLKTFNLSILDQLVIAPYVPIVFYYPNDHNSNHSVFQAIERSLVLKKSLSKTLTQFYPLAGTIKNHLSIHCNDAGANYVLALVHGHLDEFLHHPDHQLINRFLPLEPSFDESSAGAVVTNVQVNIFKCGGIAIGLCVSHKILDGAAISTFLRAWANMACGNEEVVYPNITGPLIFHAKCLWLRDMAMVLYSSLLKEGKCSTKRFVFDSNAIARLKTEASKINGSVQHEPTRVEVVSGLIWKCAMEASKESCGSHMVNLRRKLADKTSKDMSGNMIWITTAGCKGSDETTLCGLVDKVHESIARNDDEFVRKAQGDEEYVVLRKSVEEMGGNGEVDTYTFTSWCNMGFYEVDFGWGKPSWVSGFVCDSSMPVFVNLVTLVDTKCGGGVEAWVTLDEEEMKFMQCNEELLPDTKSSIMN